jgi:hypothetical protein
MHARAKLIVLSLFASAAILAAPGAQAAESPAMAACSSQWDAMKKDDKTPEGVTWSQYWSQCSKDYAAKHPTAAAAKAPKSSEPAKATTDAKTEKGSEPAKSATAATPKEPKKKKTAALNVTDTPSGTQAKRDCDAKWEQDKSSTGAHGWHDYFKFMAGCM